MHDFGKLLYLDLQKTGSTFVSRFLRQTCTLREIREWKHGRLNSRPKKSTFYFVTVRHPLAQYSSLFRYGLDGRGGLYERLAKAGKAQLYRKDEHAFSEWLRFVMDHRNAEYLGEGFETVPENFDLGFLSFRYLMMSMARPERTLLSKPATMDVLEYAERKCIVNHVVYNESLNDGLIELATRIKPQYFDQEKVREFFKAEKPVNAATTKPEKLGEVEEELRMLMWQRERVLLSLYS